MIALWNKPVARGIVIMIATFEPPLYWLKMVTLLDLAVENCDVVTDPFERLNDIPYAGGT